MNEPNELPELLRDTMADLRVGLEARRLAERLYGQWQAGLVPNRALTKLLRKLLVRVTGCGRLQADGSCAWLRKHVREEGLAPPEPGRRLLCHRRAAGSVTATYEECTGYRRPVRGNEAL